MGDEISVTAALGSPYAEMEIGGYTSPFSYIIFNEDLITIGTTVAGPMGSFRKIFTGIPPGTHSVSFYGIDSEDRNTSTVLVDVETLIYERTVLNNQLLSPTIQVDDVAIQSGDPIYATGSAYPNTTINLFTDSPLRSYATTADANGDWTYSVTNTSSYAPGDYRIYALAQTSGGIQSIFSPTILFTIGSTSGSGGSSSACGDISNGDLNCDGSFNLIDFSILMYYWGTNEAAADINSDSYVNLIDFSILMFNWGS
jgi:hypothetical protein